MIFPTMTRRGFLSCFRPEPGKPPKAAAAPEGVAGLVPAGQIFSLERFYAERRERGEDHAEVPHVTPEKRR